MLKNKLNYNMNLDIHILAKPADVATAICKRITSIANISNTLHIAISGGSTPALLFTQLAYKTYANINWKNVHFYWVDERCVSPINDESNYKMAKAKLFSIISIPSKNIHRIKGENEANEEALRYSNEIAQQLPIYNGLPQFDIILLGLGDDGHTASIFPNQITLLTDTRIAVVATHPKTAQKRISLTGSIINNAKYVAFMVMGAEKANIVNQIITLNNTEYPAAHIRPSYGMLEWFLDQEAAKML